MTSKRAIRKPARVAAKKDSATSRHLPHAPDLAADESRFAEVVAIIEASRVSL